MQNFRGFASNGARKALAIIVLPALLHFAALTPSLAQTPVWKTEKAVELVVPAAAGGGTDVAARTMQKILTDQRLVETPTVVVNKPGGGGSIGFTYVAQHRGDPHYLIVTYPSLTTNHIVGISPLKYTDLTPIAQLSNTYIGFSVRADSTLRTAKDLLDRLRKDPASVVFGTFALGAGTHLAVAMVARAAGVDPKKLKVVVFTSGNQSQAALLGGHVDLVPTGISNLGGPVQDGRLRVLAVTSPKRIEGIFAQAPTWKESGIDVVIGQWRGVMAPPGLTSAQIAYWEEVFARMDKTSEWKAELRRLADDNEYMNSRDSRRFLDAEYEDMRRILTELGMAKQN